jgi:hypothetical protein
MNESSMLTSSPHQQKCPSSRTRNERLEMVSEPISFLVPIHAPQVHYFLGTCEAHRPTYFLRDMKTIKMLIFMSPARYARKHTLLSLSYFLPSKPI